MSYIYIYTNIALSILNEHMNNDQRSIVSSALLYIVAVTIIHVVKHPYLLLIAQCPYICYTVAGQHHQWGSWTQLAGTRRSP